MTFVVFGSALVFAVLATSPAQATQPTQMGSYAAPSGGAKKSGVQTEASCGLSCRYHRANDNLTIQALYLVTKLQKIEEAYQDGGREDEIRAATGPVCKNSPSIDDCVRNYKAFQALALLKIRQSMGKNESMMVDLTHGRTVDGKVEGDFIGFATGEEADPYTPNVPTFDELQVEFESLKREQPEKARYSEQDLKGWAQSLIINNPKERLIQFDKKTVSGNPHTNPGDSNGGYRLTREVKDGMGNPVDANKDERLLYEKNAALVKGVSQQKLKAGGSTEKLLQPKDIKGKGKGYDSKDSISYQAFTEARSRIIDKVNEDTRKDGPRKPAAQATSPKKDEKDAKKTGIDPKKIPDANDRRIDSEKNVEVKSKTQPAYRTYDDNAKITRPPGSKNSRYIRYDVQELLKDIDETTK